MNWKGMIITGVKEWRVRWLMIESVYRFTCMIQKAWRLQ